MVLRGGRVALLILAAVVSQGCLTYEFEHEFWLGVDGSGTVYVTGQPRLWTSFKRLGRAEDPDGTATVATVRALFEGSGLRVRRATLTKRRGQTYLFVSADFPDLNRLSGTPAFPDLRVGLHREGERLRLEGDWTPPSPPPPGADGLVAVRFHLAGKIYEHRNAASGVERGNIVAWREDLGAARPGAPLAFGAVYDARSILWSTVALFGGAIAAAVLLLGGALAIVVRRGRKALKEP
jgi:hypothetical protein